MRTLVAMSGGVDSSVAAALLVEAGHSVVGATMKLWGGDSDTGCCSVSDVDDARRVCHQLGIDHHVFNFTEDFETRVVEPYVADHATGRTPNPCVECNRHLKFDRFLARARALGFDAVATGHHARVVSTGSGRAIGRGRDPDKDQSYVLSMLGQSQLQALALPVGEMTKAEVRHRAGVLGLRTADKPDSQDVCFITREGRQSFLARRIPLRPGTLLDSADGQPVGRVEAVELVTVGQRRGIGPDAEGRRRYALSVDPATATVRVGPLQELLTTAVPIGPPTWADRPPRGDEVLSVQLSAHGRPVAGRLGDGLVDLEEPVRRVAPGQTVALYRGDLVVGSAVAG